MLEFWWVLPAAVLFSTVAISSGISGALFFSPFFIFAVGLSPAQAIGAGLLTEIFGMGNGLRSYVRQKLVDYTWVRAILIVSVPTVVIGALIAHYLPDSLLKIIFGGGLVLLSILFLRAPDHSSEEVTTESGDASPNGRVLRAADGTEYVIPECTKGPGVVMAGFGGLLTGVISAGLPELTTTQLVLRCKMPARIAVATSVVALAVTAVAGAAAHALAATPAWNVVVWSIPGVLIGSTIGSRVGGYIPAKTMERVLAFVFGGVGLLVLGLELLG